MLPMEEKNSSMHTYMYIETYRIHTWLDARWIDGWMDRSIGGSINRWIDGKMRWMERWIDGRTDRQTNR